MFKKTIATTLLVCAMPVMASAAWQITSQVMNQGGTLTTPNGTQSSTDQALTTTQTDVVDPLTSALIFATPDSADTLRSLAITDSYIDVNGKPATAQLTLPFTPQDDHQYFVKATFSPNQLLVGASYASGSLGTVSPASLGNIYNGYKLIYPVTFTFAPKMGYTITAVAGVPAGATLTLPAAANQRATVVFPAGYTFTSAINLVATDVNNTPTLNPIAAQNATVGSSVTIAPSVNAAAGTPSYTFTYVSGPANQAVMSTTNAGRTNQIIPGPAVSMTNTTDTNGNVNGFKFTAPATAGQYKFQVTEAVSGMTKLALVNVFAQASDVSNQCQFCHTANNIPSSDPYDLAITTRYQASIHGQSTHAACSACHFGTGGSHPGSVNADTIDPTTFTVGVANVANGNGVAAPVGTTFCSTCHSQLPHTITSGSFKNISSGAAALKAGVTCVQCHTSANGTNGSDDAHAIQGLSCQGCHSVPQTNNFSDRTLVSDNNNNNGVRAVTGEFQKWSHHIVNPAGVAIQDEQCAVCHEEGTMGKYGFGVDGTKHMVDNKVHLRIANDPSDAEFAWDPANPSHSGMDNFCMACHSASGATSPMNGKLQTAINNLGLGLTASALNPFGDTISNRYDKMMRPRVTNVNDQFNTTNNSHHAVKGPRYSGRTRAAGPRQIASAATFAANSSATLQGIRSTIYDAGNFNALYVPLHDAAGETAPRTGAADLGDDSTLHCGDCHTVGQYAPGSASKADGTPTTVVIGAHGSNNEYLLRNNLGTDERHVGVAYSTTVDPTTGAYTVTNNGSAYLVCFNCHNINNYGQPRQHTAVDLGNAAGSEMNNPQPHAGEYANGGRCNGPGNTLSFNGYTTGAATDGTQFASRFDLAVTATDKTAGYQSPDFGDVYGIQCLNCHNSGYGNAYGGIHGSANDTDWNGTKAQDLLTAANITPTTKGFYIDGMGNVNKVERFLPGLGNAMYVPGTLAGIIGGSASPNQRSATPYGSTVVSYWNYSTGGVVNDANWEQKQWQQTASTVINYQTAKVTGTAYAGAGCYTLGSSTSVATNVTAGISAPSQSGAAGAATTPFDNWGGCEDHSAAQGGGNHGFLKRIVRPITY